MSEHLKLTASYIPDVTALGNGRRRVFPASYLGRVGLTGQSDRLPEWNRMDYHRSHFRQNWIA